MANKKRSLIRRLFGSKKTSFDSISADEDDDAVALQAFRCSSTAIARRHTVDVETFRGDTTDRALMLAACRRPAARHRSDLDYGGLLGRFHARLKARHSSSETERAVWPRQHIDPTKTTKPTAEPATKPDSPPTSSKMPDNTAAAEDSAEADDEVSSNKSSGSFRRRLRRKERLMRCGEYGKVDTTQPIVYPTTPETILEYHNAMPFLDANEEWLMVELNEYECLVDGLEIIKIIANHSKFFEVEPDDLWEEFFKFVDDVPAYDEVINFDVWQEFRDKKYTC